MTDTDLPDDVTSAAPQDTGGGATPPQQGGLPTGGTDVIPMQLAQDQTPLQPLHMLAPEQPAAQPTAQPAQGETHPLTDLVNGILAYGKFKHGVDQPPQQPAGQVAPADVGDEGKSVFERHAGDILSSAAGIALGGAGFGSQGVSLEGAKQGMQTAGNAYDDFTKRARKFLLGSDAMDPNAVQGIYHAVDPNGNLPENTKNYRAYLYANKTAGPDAMHSLLQYQRVKYNSLIHAVALPAYQSGNISTAIDGVNKAFETIPMTASTNFTAGTNGIVATVTSPNGQATAYTLSPQQFKAMLQISGQFDKIAGQDPNQFFAKLTGQGGDIRGPAYKQVNPVTGEGMYNAPEDTSRLGQLNEQREAGRALLENIAAKRGPAPVGGPLGPSRNEVAQQKNEVAAQVGAGRNEAAQGRNVVAQERVTGKNVNEATANAIRQARTEGQTANEQARTQNYAQRTQERTAALDRQTLARLQMTANTLQSRERTSQQQDAGRRLNAVLKYMGQPGASLADLDKELKTHGLSLNQFLPAGNAGGGAQPTGQTPTAQPVTPGKAQAPPSGAKWRDPQGNYRDANGQIIQ